MARRTSLPLRILKWLAIVVVVLAVALLLVGVALHEPRPEGETGPAADALARELEEAVNAAAWERTGAVQWTFRGANEHLWDRERHLSRVRWNGVEVLQDLSTRRGRAWENGNEVEGERRDELLEQAYAHWVNDSYWLNPLVKLFDDGVERSVVTLEDGTEALLVTYGSGGLTPGDAYLWVPGEDGLPKEWRMWVSILPIGGVTATWEGWKTLDTGAKVSSRHALGPLTLELGDIRGTETLAGLVGDEDPFAPIGPER